MADRDDTGTDIGENSGAPASVVASGGGKRAPLAKALRKYMLVLPLAALAALVLALIGLDSPIGHRLIADWLAEQETGSGLSISVGRIDGSIFGAGQLDDVVARDPDGDFLRIPVVTFDWQPLSWLDHRLDLREVVARRGVLLRLPRLRATREKGTLLPSYDVRIGRLAVERLLLARALTGPGLERRIDASVSVDIHRKRALLRLTSRLGGGDRAEGWLDADEAAGRFDAKLDYVAPKGGVLAALSGAHAAREIHVAGRGDWAAWRGRLVAREGTTSLADLALSQQQGRFALDGHVASAPLNDADIAAALGPTLGVDAHGEWVDGRLDGAAHLQSTTLTIAARGALDLHAAEFRGLSVVAQGRKPVPIGGGDHVDGARLVLNIAGGFSQPRVNISATATRLAIGLTTLESVTAQGLLQRNGTADSDAGDADATPAQGWRLPLVMRAAHADTGHPETDTRLVQLRAHATLVFRGSSLTAKDLVLGAPGIGLSMALSGDMHRGAYAMAGRAQVADWAIDGLGTASGVGPLDVGWARGGAWTADAKLTGKMSRIEGHTLATLLGDDVAGDYRPSDGTAVVSDGTLLQVELRAAHGVPLWFPQITVKAPRLTAVLTATRGTDGVATYEGGGHQTTYGAFDVSAHFADDGPHALLRLTDPVPAAGLRDVSLAFDPAGDGTRNAFALTAQGTSLLGPFTGNATLTMPVGAATQLTIHRLGLTETAITGALTLADDGIDGMLTITGGGVTGSLQLSPRSAGQAIDLTLAAHDTRFAGDQPLALANGHLEAHGLLLKHHSSLTATMSAQGLGKGHLFIGQAAGQLALADGAGQLSASLAGRRGSRFEVHLRSDIAPDQLAVSAQGTFAGQPITTPRRAVLTLRTDAEGGGWQLSPSEVDFGQGRAIASGTFATAGVDYSLALADMPLALGDVIFSDLGLGGTVSGRLTYAHPREGLPTGDVRLTLRHLTRSGLLVTSRPIDVAMAGTLSDAALELRAVAEDGAGHAAAHPLGRLQARLADLPTSGDLMDRLRAGHLMAAMRYSGPADAPWRLMALDNFDMTGPIDIAADIDGTIDDPRIRGSLASDALRLQSAETGTNITQLVARGSFAGSRLTLATLAGETAGGGQLVGSGTIDFAGITDGHGPGIDLRLAASRAAVLARSDMAMSVTGPLRIVSDGASGTIAGRVSIDTALWRLGQAPVAAALPDIATREINRRADIAPATTRDVPWRFLVDAAGASRVRVIGLGLDSEWGARLQLRGDIDSPAIAGGADLVRGSYEFSGQHFDLSRGHIAFDGASPPDPRLDIAASAQVTGLAATVNVRGTSLKPDITFTSVPPLPEEELLSRLLFGDAVSKISAPEAVQLGAALASLHGGGGLDPINRVRSLIGLDRLRIVAADPTIPRQTGVALGKNVARRVYVEVVTDGRQYSATNLEYRITRWLSLLGSLSTVGRQSVNARVSHDY